MSLLSMKSDVICAVIGEAMVDIVFPVLTNTEMSCLKTGGVITTNSYKSIGGLTNIAINLNRLGVSSLFIGKIGKDCFGKYFEKEITKTNLKAKISKSDRFPTGIVSVFSLQNKERFFIVDRGANKDLCESDIDLDLCKHSKYVYISGYSFQDQQTSNTLINLLKELSDSDVKFIFNPGAPNLVKKYKKIFKKLIKENIDILFLNNYEGKNLFGKDWENLSDYIDKFNLNKIILTKGCNGSTIINSDQILDIPPHCLNDVVDTTGAGDAFASAFIYGMEKGWNDKLSGNFAARYAGKIICNYGGF
jgi:sugar/nucleoside kinase (ribokinase family)